MGSSWEMHPCAYLLPLQGRRASPLPPPLRPRGPPFPPAPSQDVMAESARLAAEAAAQLRLADPAAPGPGDAPADRGGSPAPGPGPGPGAGPEARLWVDKYAPTGFTQLLSDEWVNREVAKWTRQWLPGARPAPPAGEAGDAAAERKRKWGQGGGRWRRKGFSRRDAAVLLICGPRGAPRAGRGRSLRGGGGRRFSGAHGLACAGATAAAAR
jgi:hypothetical protein